MSKKKNTLKDLDEFLKQQAASLVTPDPVSAAAQPPASPATTTTTTTTVAKVLPADIIENLKKMVKDDRTTFYNIIIQTLETQQPSLPADKMLINTALYLKHGDNWKEAIREYWKNATGKF